jgi:hypothetical protein
MDFIPTTDAGFAAWSTNFETGIDTEFATYGLSNAQATAYTTLDTAWQAALLAATNVATRTSITIAAKDAAKAAAVENARVLAGIVNTFPATTNAMRATLGLTPRGAGPTPIPAPVTKPVPIVVGYNPLGHVLQIRDATTPASRAKPAGVIACQVWAKIGPTAPTSLADCELVGVYTKPFLTVNFAAAAAGQKIFYLTRWQTRRGLTGPLSDVISPTLPAA